MHRVSVAATISGYLLLAALLVLSGGVYEARLTLDDGFFLATVLATAAAIAVVTVTISVFWLWERERSSRIEKRLGPAGHVLHCGSCLALWLSAAATGFFGISFFDQLTSNETLNFLLSWWTLGFVSVLFSEILIVLWFKKLQLEFFVREKYKQKEVKDNAR